MPAALFTDTFVKEVISVMPSKQEPTGTMTSPTAPSKSLRHHIGMSTFLLDTVSGGEQKQRHRVAKRCPSLNYRVHLERWLSQERYMLPNLTA